MSLQQWSHTSPTAYWCDDFQGFSSWYAYCIIGVWLADDQVGKSVKQCLQNFVKQWFWIWHHLLMYCRSAYCILGYPILGLFNSLHYIWGMIKVNLECSKDIFLGQVIGLKRMRALRWKQPMPMVVHGLHMLSILCKWDLVCNPPDGMGYMLRGMNKTCLEQEHTKWKHPHKSLSSTFSTVRMRWENVGPANLLFLDA